MDVICDECGEKFEFKDPQTRKLSEEIKEIYFVCPHCGAEFHSFYRNKEVDKLMKELRFTNEKEVFNRKKNRINEIQQIIENKLEGTKNA